MNTMIQRIGFIGIGIMGFPMARNLLWAGFSVRAFNRTRSKAEALREHGAEVVDSPAAAADGAEAVIACVGDSPDVRHVFLGASGVCETLEPGTLAIDMSTISPAVTREVAAAVEARGGVYLDAPVSGGRIGAETGTLAIMCGGSEEAFRRARPLLEAMGKTIVHCGPVGFGQLTKLCNQILCGLNLLGVCEALVLAEKVGLDLSRLLQATTAGAAGSWALAHLGEKMRNRDFAPAFMIDLQQKDLRLVLEQAAAGNLALPGTSLVSQLFAANQAAGEGREGTQALLKVLERLSNLDVHGSP
jgi:3-hydroxyisobutyrate dehydrogenase